MATPDPFLRLLDSLYAAPGTEEGWLTFLREMRHALGASESPGAFADECSRRIDVERTMALRRALVPHVRRAVELHRRLCAADDTAVGLMATIDHLPHGVFVLNAAGTVMTRNRVGRRLTAARDGLTEEKGELRPSDPRDRATLDALIMRCTTTSLERGVEAGDFLLVRRPSGRRPYRVVAAPRLRTAHVGLDTCGCLVFVTDPSQAAAHFPGDVEALWGLTPAEARLVCALVDGHTLAAASAQIGVRVQTLRKQLQSVFEKTGTHRQSELVRLVLMSTPPVACHE
jgi:DNA-binding CsgD family transcriptional regulator/PAS domain-containing protein